MNHEATLAPPVVRVEIPPMDPALAPPVLDPVSPEKVQMIDEAFALDQENQTVAGLMGLYTSAVLLTDLAKEAFHEPVVDVKIKEKKEKERE